MAKPVSPIEVIMDALPAVQAAVRREIAVRIAAGEDVSRIEGDAIRSSIPVTRDLQAERKELLARHAREREARRRQSVA